MISKHCIILLSTLVGIIHCDNVGWSRILDENPDEFHNVPLLWEMGDATNVPDWLSGVYVRNGPAQITFGSERRHLGSWLDGFAKLHTIKFDGKTAYFSGKMVESTTYMDSVRNKELVPMALLGTFENPEDEWNMMEIVEIMGKATDQFNGDLEHNFFDNLNPGVWRMGSKDNPTFFTTTDYPFIQKFDINTLDTLELMNPRSDALSGVTHWQREVGTDNSIYAMGMRGSLIKPNSVEVQRFTPENTNFSIPEVVARFNVKKPSMQHSFSVTENYAVFAYSPVVLGGGKMCVPMHAFHLMECTEVLEDEETDLYIVNLKTGEVKEMSAEMLFTVHHINAYETNDGKEIVLDLAPSDELGMQEYPLLDRIRNPPESSTSDETSTCGKEEVTRYHINLEKNEVKSSKFPNLFNGTSYARYINKFDMGVINEAYRGREYCIVYGLSMFDYSRTALVKKNVCDATKDKVYYNENHYSSEMYFIANPEGSEEDDGVLVSYVFDGPREQSYLLVLDAKNMEEIDRTYLPYNIPLPLSHGMHFPDVKWTIK